MAAPGPLSDPIDRPKGMLRDERFGITGRPLQRGQVGSVTRVSERDADISQESPALDSLDGRAAEKRAELRVVERQVIAQRHADGRSRREGRFARDLGEAVPGARIQTIVATVNPIADQGP